MLILVRPVHDSLECFVDPKGDVKTNRFIAEQLDQLVATEECISFGCRDIAGRVVSRNVWACPNWLVDELLVNRQAQNLAFDLYVRKKHSDEPPHFAVSLEDGQTPEAALRAVLDGLAIQVSCAFDLGEVVLAPEDFTFLLPSTKNPVRPPASGGMSRSQPGVPPFQRRDRRKW